MDKGSFVDPEEQTHLRRPVIGNPLSYDIAGRAKLWIYLPELQWKDGKWETCEEHLKALKLRVSLMRTERIETWRGYTIDLSKQDRSGFGHKGNEYWSYQTVDTLSRLYRPVVKATVEGKELLYAIRPVDLLHILDRTRRACSLSIKHHIGTFGRPTGQVGTTAQLYQTRNPRLLFGRQLMGQEPGSTSRRKEDVSTSAPDMGTKHGPVALGPAEGRASTEGMMDHKRGLGHLEEGYGGNPNRTMWAFSQGLGVSPIVRDLGGIRIDGAEVKLDVMMSSGSSDRFESGSVMTIEVLTNHHKGKQLPGVRRMAKSRQSLK